MYACVGVYACARACICLECLVASHWYVIWRFSVLQIKVCDWAFRYGCVHGYSDGLFAVCLLKRLGANDFWACLLAKG